MVGFSSSSLFPTRKQEAGIDHPTRRRTQGAGIVKGWEDKRDPRAHSRYIHVKQEQHGRGPSDPPTIEPRLPPPLIYISMLTTSVSAGLSKYSGSIHLIHTIQSHNNTTTYLTRWNWIFGPFPPDFASSFPPE